MRSFWRFLPLTGLAPKSSPETRIGTSEDRLNFASFGVHLRLVQAKRRQEPGRDVKQPERVPLHVRVHSRLCQRGNALW